MKEAQLHVARYELMNLFPFFAEPLFAMKFVEEPGLGTFAVDDGWKMYWDPALPWNQKHVRTGLLHEMLHLVRNHAARCKTHGDVLQHVCDPERWNAAADCEINGFIRKLAQSVTKYGSLLGFPKTHGVFPKTFGMRNGLTAEAYYDQLRDNDETNQRVVSRGGAAYRKGTDGVKADRADRNTPKAQPEPPKKGKGKKRQAQPEPEDVMPDDGGTTEHDPDAASKEHHAPRVVADCGGAADGRRRRWEKPDADDVTPQQARDIVKRIVGQADAAGAGSLVREFIGIDAAADAQATWVETLDKTVQQHMQMRGRGFARPSRRFQRKDIVFPGKATERPRIVFVCDVSGSIGVTAAQRAFAIISRFEGWHIDFKVVAFGTHAKEVDREMMHSRKGWYAGGGTNINPALHLVRTKHSTAEMVIIITDGETAETPGSWERLTCPTYVFTWSRPGPAWTTTVKMPRLK